MHDTQDLANGSTSVTEFHKILYCQAKIFKNCEWDPNNQDTSLKIYFKRNQENSDYIQVNDKTFVKSMMKSIWD